MNDDFLQRLAAASSDDERHWLVVENLLASLPPELAQMAWAATVPHWFDAKILAALRPELADRAERLYPDLQRLPFVEPFAGRGHNVHELTRRLVLAYLWRERRDEFVTASQRAADHFAGLIRQSSERLAAQIKELERQEPDKERQAEQLRTWIEEQTDLREGLAPRTHIEHIYHLLAADPEKGAEALRRQGWQWHDTPLNAYALVGALAQAVREHAEAGRIDGRGRGWGRFWEGLVASDYYRYPEAIAAFREVIAANYDDNHLNADARFRLGDVYLRLSELPEARAKYEEALPLYRAIGARLGEANCIKSLGDVHVALSELPEARAKYEEALPLYRAIGEKLGEANCIKSLGDVHVRLSELTDARARYEEALPLYRAIGARLGEANCISSLGDVHVRLSELPDARARYEEALPLYRAIGEKLGEANCIKSLGDVSLDESDFASAIRSYEEALAIRRAISPADEAAALNPLAIAYEKQKNYLQAIEIYTRALELFPDHAFIRRNRANLYLKLKDAESAARDIEAAARLQPDNAYLFLRRGQLAILLGQHAEAVAHFHIALEHYPRMNDAHFGIGLAHLRAGQPDEALKAYQDGLSLTDARKELDDAIEDLEELKAEHPSLIGIEGAIQLLQHWQPLHK